jgi:hypothetical protein
LFHIEIPCNPPDKKGTWWRFFLQSVLQGSKDTEVCSFVKMSLQNSCYSIVHDIPPVLMNVNGPEPMFRQGSIPGEHYRIARASTWTNGDSVRLDNFICGHYSQPGTGKSGVFVPMAFETHRGMRRMASSVYLDFSNDPFTIFRMALCPSVSH